MALGVIARALPYAAKLVKELAKKKGSTTKFTLNGSVIYGTMTS